MTNLQGYGPIGLAESELGTPPSPYLFFVLPYANVIEGHTVGAEIAPNWKIKPWWQVRGSYSFLHMSLRDKPGFTDTGSLLSSYMGSSPSQSRELPIALQLAETFRVRPNVSILGARFLPKAWVPIARLTSGWDGTLEKVSIFRSSGRTCCGPLTRNLEVIPARWWGSREASTERLRGEGEPSHSHEASPESQAPSDAPRKVAPGRDVVALGAQLQRSCSGRFW